LGHGVELGISHRSFASSLIAILAAAAVSDAYLSLGKFELQLLLELSYDMVEHQVISLHHIFVFVYRQY